MKRKTRTISVNHRKFVWWYKIREEETILTLSPFGDKVSVVSVVFPAETQPYIPCAYLYHESVVMTKDGEEYCIKIISPRMAGLILGYFTEKQQIYFTRKKILLNGYTLLAQMGYEVTEVKMGLYW